MKKLDDKDYLLLDLLSQGSRKGIGRLAKELKLHKNSVLYRIKRLKKMGIINRFSFMVKIPSIGKETHVVFFRLRVNEEEKKVVYDYLRNHPSTLWVARISGKWNALVELICEDIATFNDELAKITDHLGNKVSDYESVLMYRPYKIEPTVKFVQEYKEEPFKPPKKVISLDPLDKKILAVLSESSDLSYGEIAGKVNANPDTVFYRMKKLIKNEVIRKFIPIINVEKLGYQGYVIKLKLSDINHEDFQSLKNYLVNNRNIAYAFRTGGELGVLMYCAYKTNSELDNFLTNLVASFGDVIREQEVFISSETIKLDYFPEILRK